MSDDRSRALTPLHIECSQASLVRRPVSRPSSSEAVQPAGRFVAFCRSCSSMGQNNPVDLISQYADPMVPYAKYPDYCGRVCIRIFRLALKRQVRSPMESAQQNYIGGTWVPAGATAPNVNPSNVNDVIANYARA